MSESLMASSGSYGLCLVGAGYAGLNAAFVASQYIPATGRVLLLDKHEQPGGMWNDAYSYVRLHQPHKQFTVGNIAWSLRQKRSYLATRAEVAAHLRDCFDVVSKRLDVDARWGWEYLSHSEEADSVTVTARGTDGEIRVFTARRFIDARGFEVESIHPLPLASRDVCSVAPQELENSGVLSDNDCRPVWVIGSGKTAMDTVVALVRANPARPIGMVTGTGTYFYNRDLVNPTGLKRWTGGVRYNAIFAAAAKRFDGTNAAEVSQWCRTQFGTSPLVDPPPTHLLFALLSESETLTVANGLNEIIRDHLSDVVDEASGPVMVLRTGARHPIRPGSWIVNCTGHLPPRSMEHVPYVSPSGKAMSINLTSTVFPSPGAAAYLLAHMFFRDKLADAPLYELDFHGLRSNAPEATLAVVSSLVAYNLSFIFERVPLKAFRDFRLDIDRWYPPVRQLAGQLQFMRTRKRDREHHRQALDTFSKQTDVRCGPLSLATPSNPGKHR